MVSLVTTELRNRSVGDASRWIFHALRATKTSQRDETAPKISNVFSQRNKTRTSGEKLLHWDRVSSALPTSSKLRFNDKQQFCAKPGICAGIYRITKTSADTHNTGKKNPKNARKNTVRTPKNNCHNLTLRPHTYLLENTWCTAMTPPLGAPHHRTFSESFERVLFGGVSCPERQKPLFFGRVDFWTF